MRVRKKGTQAFNIQSTDHKQRQVQLDALKQKMCRSHKRTTSCLLPVTHDPRIHVQLSCLFMVVDGERNDGFTLEYKVTIEIAKRKRTVK